MSRTRPRVIALIALAAALSGCANQRHSESNSAPATTGPADTLRPRAVAVLDGHDGDAKTWLDMIAECAAADVVIIGEMHGHDLGLAVAAAIWDDLLARARMSPSSARPARIPALSMEFFERDTQPILDDYLTGVIDEETFRDLSRRTPGNYPPGHAQMIESARKADAPVFAANAPRRYSTLSRKRGYDAIRQLRPTQRALIALPALDPEGPYRDRFFAIMSEMMTSHGPAGESTGDGPDPAAVEAMVEGFFRAQSVWDATMADTLAAATAQGYAPVVHVVGQFHSDFEGGTVLELRQRAPGLRIVTISMSDDATPAVPTEDLGRADFIIPVGPAN